MSTTRCSTCGAPVDALPIDDTDERILVSGDPVHVAIRIPDLVGYVTTSARRVHRCRRGRRTTTNPKI